MTIYKAVVLMVPGILGINGLLFSQPLPRITRDKNKEQVTLSDGSGNLMIRVNYSHGCVLDKIVVNGTTVTGAPGVVYSGVRVDSQFFSSRKTNSSALVSIAGDSLVVGNITFGSPAFAVKEEWIFNAGKNDITWQIRRQYLNQGTVEENELPCWQFKSMATWEGALLDNGGVAWNRLLSEPGDTYGSHAGMLTFWNKGNDNCLRITPSSPYHVFRTVTFSHEKNSVSSVVQSTCTRPVTTRYGLRRFLTNGKPVFAPMRVEPGSIRVTYRLQVFKYDSLYDRGTWKGLDGQVVNEMLNTIGRYGVVDQDLYGSNGWRSGYVVLQEPWLALLGLAVDAPEFIHGYSRALTYEKSHAIGPDGRVLPRWHQDASDAMAHTYQPDGFYECQWGYMLDAQPAFAIDVADQFKMTGDINWLRGFKPACEKVLGYMIDRYLEKDGLFRVVQSTYRDHKGCDWMDVVWASYEVASINAYMYKALIEWSGLEKLLGDKMMADQYRDLATRLKVIFNKDVADGGFWNPEKKWYDYWREKDNAVYGDNLVTNVNFLAIGYGLCEDTSRQDAILGKMEQLMEQEKLFIWPSCFFSYKEGLGLKRVNYPFPNYENGDLFLAWAGLGVHAYAQKHPEIALKYIRNVIRRYETDGLAYQRYTRVKQTGAGGDILSNNIMAIVGLYRDIYGIEPRHNRLYLNPHLPKELNGTHLNYWLRNQNYSIALSRGKYAVTTGRFSVSASSSFGVNATGKELRYFDGNKGTFSMLISTQQSCFVHIDTWTPELMRWRETTSRSKTFIRHEVRHLSPGGHYGLSVGKKQVKELTADKKGAVHFSCPAGQPGEEVQLVFM